MNKDLSTTVELMKSNDYKERFIAEYVQTKIRYEKLKSYNTKIEAKNLTDLCYEVEVCLTMPPHDCPDGLLREQQRIMGEYLHVLELRAVIEGIDLEEHI